MSPAGHNLKAHPDVAIEIGTQTVDVTAGEATGEERERLLDAPAAATPAFAAYREQTERTVPVIVLPRRWRRTGRRES